MTEDNWGKPKETGVSSTVKTVVIIIALIGVAAFVTLLIFAKKAGV